MTDEQLAEAWKGLATWAKDSAISPLLIKFGRAVATTAVEAERQKDHPETPDSWAQAIPEDRAALVERIKEQAQVFASAWSLVGGKFDFGDAMQDATEAKKELHAMVDSLAASPPPSAEPEGWQLVPKKPTPLMLERMQDQAPASTMDLWNAWQGALAAAPKEPKP